MASLVGSRVERKEDGRFLQGKGRYTADINIANQTYAVFIRSPHARAKIKKIDTSKALKASGVVDILTGEHIAQDKKNHSFNIALRHVTSVAELKVIYDRLAHIRPYLVEVTWSF